MLPSIRVISIIKATDLSLDFHNAVEGLLKVLFQCFQYLVINLIQGFNAYSRFHPLSGKLKLQGDYFEWFYFQSEFISAEG